MHEPSVLDFFKALLTPWRGSPPPIPLLSDDTEQRETTQPPSSETVDIEPTSVIDSLSSVFSVLTESGPVIFALLATLIAQLLLEPPLRSLWLMLFLLAAALTSYAAISGKWNMSPIETQDKPANPLSVKTLGFLIGLPFTLIAYFTLGGNSFSSFNLLVWAAAIGLLTWALWLPRAERSNFIGRIRGFLSRPSWSISISRWAVLLALAFGIAVFFRTYQFNDANREMISSHIENLHDVYDVVNGQTSIFFQRNTGRLGLLMYVTAVIVNWFNTGFTFLSLKLGTILAGLLMLPYMYLLGKEIANRYVGLLAVIISGIAFWPNILARIGMRFIFYPVFVAPTLYYLIRGLRRNSRNDFILSGIALGIGLYGYAPIRVLPLVILAAVLLFTLHQQSKGTRRETWIYLGILLFIALLFFLPQLRFIAESEQYRNIYNYRTMIRLGELERPYPGSPLLLFVQNFWDAIRMPNVY
ncbi:MAG: glycosyltransferase family 39 protein, partial [Anaerolineae bacterium]|nr:glycosyltransferase family 39 protein [Anaerolineae bacterium]